MNKLRLILLVFVNLMGSCALMAQNVSDLPANSFPFNLTGQTVKAFDNRYEGVRGSYTFLEEFGRGTVVLSKGKFSDVLINYDAYSDNLLAQSEKVEGNVQLRKDMILSFILKDAMGVEHLFVKKNIGDIPVFLLEIEYDSISIYCKVGKIIKRADYEGAYNTSVAKYDEFITVNTYYLVRGDGELQEFQGSKKGILKALPEFEEQLSEYLKKNKTDFNDYGQVRTLTRYINALK